MPPRAFTNPAPKTESARSALSAFTCTLCNKSYSRHPEYEAHIGSYDHQHRKRLQDLKQLSRDPNAAEKARRAEHKADAEAGLKVIDSNSNSNSLTAVDSAGESRSRSGNGSGGGGAFGKSAGGAGGGGGFKKGGFKSSFASVKGPASVAPVKKNVLGDEDGGDGDGDGDGDGGIDGHDGRRKGVSVKDSGKNSSSSLRDDVESDTDEEYGRDPDGGGYYDPRRPTGCFSGCAGMREVKV